MELTYRQEGDYLIPNLEMEEQPKKNLGRYGRARERYLEEKHRGIYSSMLLKGTLLKSCLETEERAYDLEQKLTKEMAKTEGVTEELKQRDQLSWVQQMNNIKARAQEIVMAEVIETL